MNSDISANLLYSAMTFFKSRGYQFITAPMLVDEDIAKLTLHEGKITKHHGNKCYVGSAEQSIYQLIKDGNDLPAKVLAITPCQRDDEPDDIHQEIFLKIELACTDNSITYRDIATDVIDFYNTVTDKAEIVDFSSFDNTLDININGIEVGSYGQREYKGRSINFGTGLALPRFIKAINYERSNQDD